MTICTLGIDIKNYKSFIVKRLPSHFNNGSAIFFLMSIYYSLDISYLLLCFYHNYSGQTGLPFQPFSSR